MMQKLHRRIEDQYFSPEVVSNILLQSLTFLKVLPVIFSVLGLTYRDGEVFFKD